jgi:hypothetical protein
MTDRWRVGRRVGRTIYRMVGPDPSDNDQLIGMMDTVDLARRAVLANNFLFGQESITVDVLEAPFLNNNDDA